VHGHHLIKEDFWMRRKVLFILLAVLFMATSVALLAQMKQPVEPVNWRELTPFLIDIPDWQAEGDADGSSVAMGSFKISQAERSYAADEKNLTITIIDGGYVPMVYAGMKMAMGFEVDTSEEYVKKITIKDFPGIEKYEYGDKQAEVIILVVDRFLLQLEGENFENTTELKEIAELLDLEGIANLAQ
jgi:hypothetical protein